MAVLSESPKECAKDEDVDPSEFANKSMVGSSGSSHSNSQSEIVLLASPMYQNEALPLGDSCGFKNSTVTMSTSPNVPSLYATPGLLFRQRDLDE